MFFHPFLHLSLLVNSPKNYIYSLLHPESGVSEFHEYTPKASEIAHLYIDQIAGFFPKVSIEFVGSASYQIFGDKEIDLFLRCDKHNFQLYLPSLLNLLGNPNRKSDRIIQWFFPHNGYTIDICLVDPTLSQYREEMAVIEILRNDPTVLQQYETLKRRFHKKSAQQYRWEKMAFFNELLKKQK